MINYPLRFALATVAPIGLYTLGYWGNYFYTSERKGFFRKEPWLVIFGLAALFPLNRPLLWMLFRPIEKKLVNNVKKMVPAPHNNPFLIGNYAPIHSELSYKVTDIRHGNVPADISGAYIKTGTNAIQFHESGAYHWFDGDAMFHAFRLKDGELHYCNKQIMTPSRKQERKYGSRHFQLGAMVGTGVLATPLRDLQNSVGYYNDAPFEISTSPNTAITYFQKHVLGLCEINLPFHVKLDQKRNGTLRIQEQGHTSFDGQLDHVMTAHPKIDRQTNELFAFGYDIQNPRVYLSVFDENLKKTKSLEWQTMNPRLLHEFSLSENFAIIPDLPLEFNPKRAIAEKAYVFHHNLEGKAMFGFHPRSSSSSDDTIWIEAPGVTHFFHQGNAWEEPNEAGDLLVHIFAGVSKEFDPQFPGPEPLMHYVTRFEKLTFNISKRKFEGGEILIPDSTIEFPVVEQSLVGYKNRYTYMAYTEASEDTSQEARDNINFRGFYKYDHLKEKVVAKVSFGESHTGGEVFFQRKTSASEEITPENEDEGYLMTAVHNWKTDTSEFVMWDAASLGEGSDEPILRAGLEQRVPNGFHTMFVPENELN